MTQYLERLSCTGTDSALNNYVEKVANDLINRLTPDATVTNSYRKLLANAITMAAESQQEADKNSEEIKHLNFLSTTDEVTMALNRRGFSIALRQTLERARRQHETGFLLIIDMDGFKQINDTFGHAVGDKVLKTVASCLMKHTRTLDSVARIGGDEFAVILGNITPERGELKAQELENTINNLSMMWDGNTINIRASFGYEPYGICEEEDGLLAKADSNMYAQKRDRQKAITYAAD